MKKKIFLMVLILTVFLLIWGTSCGVVGGRIVKEVLEGKRNKKGVENLIFGWCTRGFPIVEELEKLLQDNVYLVLLQNNNELRATGGFMGSYVRIVTSEAGIEDMTVQDIYVPDGQIVGHVEPPYPIQEAFGQGWWRLRDANWDPDFPKAATTIAWFFEQGGEKKIDGIVAVNMELVKRWVEMLGEVKPVTYDEIVTKDNLFPLAQKYAEVDGEKRDFLGAVGTALIEDTKRAGWVKMWDIAELLMKELKKGQVAVWFKNEELQEEMGKKQWTGELERGWDGESDYLYIVESNLGANKANCCVTRSVSQYSMIDAQFQKLETKLRVEWKNDNLFENSKPPVFWGGDYRNYVRVIVPAEVEVLAVRVGDLDLRRAEAWDFEVPNSLRTGMSEGIYVVEKKGKLQSVGFWAITKAQESRRAEVRYRAGIKDGVYTTLVKRQPGIEELEYQLIYKEKIVVSEAIDRDKVFVVKSEQ